MKITFLLPNIELRGGVRTVIDYSDRLAGMGEDVTVVFPTRLRRMPFVLNELEYMWRAPHKLLTGRWFSTRARILAVPSLEPRYIPRADVVVATAWQTAMWAATYPRNRGARHYFIQDIETYSHPEEAAATYLLDFRRVATSPWIRDELKVRYGVQIHALVPCGVDFDLYKPSDSIARESTQVRIGTLCSSGRRKGFDIAISVIRRLRSAGQKIVFKVLGAPREPSWVADCDDIVSRLRPEETPSFYRSCDVWLCASRSEGFYLPGLEALACGCALVTTGIGGTVYYAVPDRTALVCDPGDEDALLRATTRLIESPALRQALSREALSHVRRYDVDTAARNFHRLLNGEMVSVEPDTLLTARHCD